MRLKTDPFGALFDYFCDYLTLVVAPWILGRALIGELTYVQEAALGLPLGPGPFATRAMASSSPPPAKHPTCPAWARCSRHSSA